MEKPSGQAETRPHSNKGGRPRIILLDNEIKTIETLAGYGLTLAQIAAVIGISEGLLFERQTHETQVIEALERGRAKAQGVIGKSLFERARDGDVAAIRWWEMTRAGRTEAKRHEMTGKDGAPLAPPQQVVFQIGGHEIDPVKLGWSKPKDG